jgi:ribosomal protein S18 acetylase RimI-like enzyme
MVNNAWDDLNMEATAAGLNLRWAQEEDFARVREIVLAPSTLAAVQATQEEADRNIQHLWEGDPHDSEIRHLVVERLDDNFVIAYVRLLYPFPQPPQMEPASLWMSYFAVAPDARSQGYGRKIMQMLIQSARRNTSVRLLGLHTSTSNTAAIRLYESVGFVCARQEPWPSFVEGRDDERMTMVIQR